MLRQGEMHILKHVSRGENVDAKAQACGKKVKPTWLAITSNDRFLKHRSRNGVRFPAKRVSKSEQDNSHSLALRHRVLECHILKK